MQIKKIGLLGLVSTLAAIVGCPTFGGGNNNGGDPNSGSGGPNQLTGTWKGTLSCSTIQMLGSSPSTPSTTSVPNFTITFDSSGKPASITILGFVGVTDAEAQIQDVGESQTLHGTGTTTSTTTPQVSSALYTSTGATVVIAITYHATSGNLTQDGTGQQTLTITVSGDSMNYKNEVTYTVKQVAGTVNLDTGETKTCTGTLARQAATTQSTVP